MSVYEVTMERKQFVAVRVEADTEWEALDEANSLDDNYLDRLAITESAGYGENFYSTKAVQVEEE